jgi:hypothetical protein
MAVAGAAALALTACSGDGGGGAALGPDAAPAEVVAAGLDDRLENGAAFTLKVDGDLAAIGERTGEPMPPEMESLLTEGLVSGAFAPERGVALSIGGDGGFLEMRGVEEALYLRLDLEQMASTLPDAGDLPPPEVLRGQLQSMPLPPNLSAVAQAALDGDWVGITGLTQEAIQDFASSMGAVPDEQASEQQEALMDVLEERGLLDGQAFTEQYLTVEGEGPTYDVTVMARALVATLEEISAEVEGTVGAAAGDMDDLPSPDEVPETLSGFSVTVEDGTATAVAADMAAVAESAGESADDIEVGEFVVTLELDDIGDQLDVPADATTIGFEELITGVMGGLMGGGLGGSLTG